MQSNRLEVGKIVRAFGIKGFVRVYPYVNNINRFDNLKKVYINNKGKITELEIQEVKYQKNLVNIKFKGIENADQANNLKDASIEINRKDAIPLEKDEFFIADLLGLNVFTDSGEKLGILEDIYNTGSSDIFVVKNELGKQYLLPHISNVIKEINVKDEKIVVHLLEGLI